MNVFIVLTLYQYRFTASISSNCYIVQMYILVGEATVFLVDPYYQVPV